VKAAREADIPAEKIVLIGEERDPNFEHLEDILAGVEQTGKMEKLDCERDLAFLVYSSGTTGLPKGVMLSHLNVVSDLFMVNSSEGTLLDWRRDKVLSVLPYYHIYGISSIVSPSEQCWMGIESVNEIQDFNASSTSPPTPASPQLSCPPSISRSPAR